MGLQPEQTWNVKLCEQRGNAISIPPNHAGKPDFLAAVRQLIEDPALRHAADDSKLHTPTRMAHPPPPTSSKPSSPPDRSAITTTFAEGDVGSAEPAIARRLAPAGDWSTCARARTYGGPLRRPLRQAVATRRVHPARDGRPRGSCSEPTERLASTSLRATVSWLRGSTSAWRGPCGWRGAWPEP